jgi:hypothetical protein
VQDLVKAGFSAGLLSSGTETTLLSDLTNAANPVKTNLTNFINAVSAFVTSRTISAAEGTLLKGWAQDLFNHS